jgi:response regulator RpfG family c-di-GMP phosphodiesterase
MEQWSREADPFAPVSRRSARQAEGTVRSALHHMIAAALLTVYGYHVCNFVSGLAVAAWLSALAPILLLQWVARTALARSYVSAAAVGSRPRLAFLIEASAFAIGGALLGAINVLIYGFPPGSGVKVGLGFFTVGLFAGADAAIARNLARFDDGGLKPAELPHRAPFALRAGLVAATIMSLLTAISSLLVLRAFEELTTGGRSGFLRVALELLFVLAVFMGYSFNLVRGLGNVIGRALREQIETLKASHGTVSDRRAVVATTDEFGLITREINVLLDALETNNRDASRANESMIRGLVTLAGARDNETGRHLQRTQRYVELIAQQLAADPAHAAKLSPQTIQLMRAAAPLHDIGKVGVPDRVLRKPGPLDAEEFALMRNHVGLGLGVLDDIVVDVGPTPFLEMARDVIAGHHERWDGRGYPHGLAGEAIPLAGRIMAVADVYDALRSPRVYKPAMAREEAKRVIMESGGTHFDPQVVVAFLLVEPEIARTADALADDPAELAQSGQRAASGG